MMHLANPLLSCLPGNKKQGRASAESNSLQLQQQGNYCDRCTKTTLTRRFFSLGNRAVDSTVPFCVQGNWQANRQALLNFPKQLSVFFSRGTPEFNWDLIPLIVMKYLITTGDVAQKVEDIKAWYINLIVKSCAAIVDFHSRRFWAQKAKFVWGNLQPDCWPTSQKIGQTKIFGSSGIWVCWKLQTAVKSESKKQPMENNYSNWSETFQNLLFSWAHMRDHWKSPRSRVKWWKASRQMTFRRCVLSGSLFCSNSAVCLFSKLCWDSTLRIILHCGNRKTLWSFIWIVESRRRVSEWPAGGSRFNRKNLNRN